MIDLPVTNTQLMAALPSHLAEVEKIFEAQIASDLPPVADLLEHVAGYRGKMLRPTLTLLSGMAASGGDYTAMESTSLRQLAAVIEMIHMATLVHDDVLDEADERRGTVSVNHLRGNEMAVMLGDYLISNAFHLCSKIGDPSLNESLGETTGTLCEGELVQLHHRDDLGLDLPTYLEIVRRKTAVLVGACGELGARVCGGDEKTCAAFRIYGEKLGIAFQVRDDVLDLEGDQELVGKTLGRDLVTGKLTLPLILLLEEIEADRFDALVEKVQARDADWVLARLRESGSIAKAVEFASQYIDEAKTAVAGRVPDSMKDVFNELADSVLLRQR